MRIAVLVALTTVLSCAGCASYLTPGGAARLADINRPGAAEEVSRQPSPHFPLQLGVVRVQAPEYKSPTSSGFGKGRYSVVASQELLTREQLQALAEWPKVAGVAMLDAELLPEKFESLDELRLAAAKQQADVLLVYTVDTAFQLQGARLSPQSKLKLGDKPDAAASIGSTVSAVFVDVRTGYTYASAQGNGSAGALGEAWQSDKAVDAKRLAAERAAFAALTAEAQKAWGGIVSRYQ